MSRFHTIVLGLGAVGSAALYHLARSGCRVLGLDRYQPPHSWGSTHGETRVTRLAIGEGAEYTPLALRSHELWRDIQRATGKKLLTRCGGLIIRDPEHTDDFHDVPAFFENTLSAALEYGIEHRVLEARDVRRCFPQFKVKDGVVGYHERKAGFLRVEECVRVQLDLARESGAATRFGEKVERFETSGGGVAVTTGSGTYRAGNLLVAAGSWLPRLMGPPYGDLFEVTRRVLHWFEITAAPETFSPGRFPVFIWGPTYGFPAVGGSASVPVIKIGTEQAKVIVDPDDREMRGVSAEEEAATYASRVEPYLRNVGSRSLRSVVCTYTEAPGARFVVDTHPEHERVIFASACSGHGFKHSAALGEALAQRVVHGESRLLDPFSLARLGEHTDRMSSAQLSAYQAVRARLPAP